MRLPGRHNKPPSAKARSKRNQFTATAPWVTRAVLALAKLPTTLSRPSETDVIVLLGRNNPDLFDNRDNSISRRHANLTARRGRYFFVDIGSSCGTWVNGVEVRTDEVELHVGDQIRLGDCLFVLQESTF